MSDPQYIVQWNCRGLTTKMGELRERLRLCKLRAWAFLLQATNGLPRLPNFRAYATPSIPDGSCGSTTSPPGKAAFYVHTAYAQTPIPLEAWCTAWQEMVAVKVQLSRCAIILVSCYVRPHSGRAPRLRLGWLTSLRRSNDGCPILVTGDLNAPHCNWGYPTLSERGRTLLEHFNDAHF